MKRCLRALPFIAVSHLAVAESHYASLQIPKQIQYQGRVATANGAAWSGTEGYFSFALVQGATVLWNNWEGTASPSDPGAVSLGAGQVLTLLVSQGVFSIRLGEGSDTNEQIPPTVFFNTTSNSVRAGVKLAVWFSPSGSPPFTRLSPDVDFTSVPFAMVSGIAETVKERAVTTSTIGVGAVEAQNLAPNSVSGTAIVADTVTSSDLVPAVREALNPPGTILPYGGTTAPLGYLMCAGQSYAKSTYPALVAALGNAFGADASTFRVPDLRGRFLRGTDDPDGGGISFSAAGRDPDSLSRSAMNTGGNLGNAVGSVQNDEFKAIVIIF